jgi:hypothetical protein
VLRWVSALPAATDHVGVPSNSDVAPFVLSTRLIKLLCMLLALATQVNKQELYIRF